jgi:hypothetical protein
MRETRRQFLCSTGAAVAGAAFSLQVLPLDAQVKRHKMPVPPAPSGSTQDVPAPSEGTIAQSPSQRAILQQHEKEFRESLAALSERINELKAEVEQLHSSNIFSVKIYKQTNEIERMAKHLKSLARG